MKQQNIQIFKNPGESGRLVIGEKQYEICPCNRVLLRAEDVPPIGNDQIPDMDFVIDYRDVFVCISERNAVEGASRLSLIFSQRHHSTVEAFLSLLAGSPLFEGVKVYEAKGSGRYVFDFRISGETLDALFVSAKNLLDEILNGPYLLAESMMRELLNLLKKALRQTTLIGDSCKGINSANILKN